MMSSPAGLQQGQINFISHWVPDSTRAGVILHGSPGDASSGSVRSSGSLVVQDPDDSFISQFAPLPISRSSSCASVDMCSLGGGSKTPGETQLSDASLNSEMQSIQDILRNTRDLPLIAKLEQLKQMQYRMQEQLKAHQQEQLLRQQREPQRLLAIPQNTAETTVCNREPSVVALNTEHDSHYEFEESLQSTTEDQTMYRKESDSEPQDRPIKSGFGGRTFEEILEEQLKMENQKLTNENPPAKSVKVKRPFLKRGEGLARFTRGKATVPSNRKSPPNPKPSSGQNPKKSQVLDMKSKRNSINKSEGSKSTHPMIQRKTAVLNKENFPQNKTTGPVTKMTLQPHVLVAHQGQNMGSISAQILPKPDPLSNMKINNATPTDCNKERECNRIKDNASVAENSFEVWFTERREHWEQDHKRERAELGEFELLERAADEISFSSNSSFISTLLQRDRRRLSSTPIKSTGQSTLPSQALGPTAAPGLMLGHRAPAPPINTAIQKDIVSIELKELCHEETDEKFDDSSCSNSELEPLSNISNPPINHFQVPITLPYDKRTYQDRDGASSPEGDDRNSSHNEDSTLKDSRTQLEFDDDDTWNDPEDESSCPVEESPSERMLKRKVAFSKGVKPVGGSPKAGANRNEAPSTSQLVAKLFPALKPKPSPVMMPEPQNKPSEEGAAQSRLLRERLVELETEIERFKSENAALARLKQENQDIRENLKKDKADFEKKRIEETAKWEEYKSEEYKKMQREKKLFEKHAATVRARPDKQERDEIQALKQQLNMMQEDLRKREARWSNTQKRLRQQVESLSSENTSLRDQVRTLEKLRLSAWKSAEKEKEKGRSSTSSSRTSTGSKPTDSKSPSHSSKGNSSRKGSPETQISLTDSAFFPEVKETQSFKSELSPLVNQSSGVLVMNERSQDAPLNNSFPKLTITGQTNEKQEEIMQSDSKIEKMLPDGGRLVVFPNGTRKELSADGQTVKVMFFNGDVKHTMPDQRVIYYYAEAQTTHITYPDGMEVLQFPNNQTEKHFPDGRKEITFPDQTVKTLHPDGREESVLTDGTIIQLNPDGSKVIQFNTGQREIHTADFKRREYPDGTVKTVYSDGRQETQYPTGRVRLKDPQGKVIMDTKA
ncbi:centrosomal P4.1-associated protein [Danio rerio]|uniref:Centrosomal P4.1-associated protein n=2 Tax=Danio rerio TaxID=7955 RepID=E7FCY1_DANRE|nr:centromere protein J [Danio rerio]XP_697409.4 centromere protein J [Danio rerio]|eukprot:XP_021334644.1 centromere protein J [Danio rerio]